jgi:putative integral membrane protein (TIGR02587 family)
VRMAKLDRVSAVLAAPHAADANRHFGVGLARAFAGAVIFGLPLLMTMEMWWLGFTMEPARLALLLVLFFPVLVLLSWHAGFERTFSWRDDVVDALVAYGVGFVSAFAVLGLLAIVGRETSLRELVGQVCLQAVPASIGALLAQTLLGQRHAGEDQRPGPHYASEVFIMGVGALFLAFNLAPTDEMVLIGHRMAPWHSAALVLVTVGVMHAFVYNVSFRGQHEVPEDKSAGHQFLHFTALGYAVSLLLCAYRLWTFGRFEGLGAVAALQAAVVLAFPAGIGAAAARLIL